MILFRKNVIFFSKKYYFFSTYKIYKKAFPVLTFRLINDLLLVYSYKKNVIIRLPSIRKRKKKQFTGGIEVFFRHSSEK